MPNLARRAATASALLVGMKGESPAKLTPRNRTRSPLAAKWPLASTVTRLVSMGELRPEKSVIAAEASFQGRIHGMVCAAARLQPEMISKVSKHAAEK